MMFVLLACVVPLAAVSGEREEEFWLAARKGDATAVNALLAQGVDVNSKFRYGATALSYACDRGHVEVVKILLAHGADVNVKDTFYGFTPLNWAMWNGHTEVVKLLLERGAEGKADVLMRGVALGKLEFVQVVLEEGDVKAEILSAALGNAARDGHSEIAAVLRKAGAQPPRQADFPVELATLQNYAGTYRNDSGWELVFTVEEGKLVGWPAGPRVLSLGALDNVTFRPGDLYDVTLTFNLEGEKVTGLTVWRVGNQYVFRRVQGRQE